MTIPECSYTTSGTPSIIGVTSFTYGSGRRDVLSKITLPDGQTFTPTHDIVGNPSHVMTGNGNRYAATWSYGRRLTGLSSGSEAFSYSYNADGIRTAKTVNGVKHTYALSGTTILNEEWTENGVQHLMMYVYDANGSPVGMVYRNSTMAANATEEYLFVKNIQGDILHVYNSAGKKLVSYVYDAWGNIISTTYSNGGGTSAARFNSFTYRGYYRDSETGMYYLNSRYYNPKMGRFISADAYVSTGQGLLGYNMYAYCGNNPVNRIDSEGEFWIAVLIFTSIATVCSVALSGCSARPTSDVGAAQPYVNMQGSDDPTSPNCYAYAIGSPYNEQPGATSGRFPTKWNDVNDVGKSVEADLKVKGYTVRKISGPNAKVYDNEFKIALRVGTKPYGYNPFTGQLYYDYHFMRQTNTGQWAEKHGTGGASVLWAPGMTPDTIPWTLGGREYYDSKIIYYAIGN